MIKPCVYVDGGSLATVIGTRDPAAESERLSAVEGSMAINTGRDIDQATFERLRYKNSCLLADSFSEAGINVVVELDVTGNALRQEVLPQFRREALLPGAAPAVREDGHWPWRAYLRGMARTP